MKVLVIDNIDSFVYNLVQYIGDLGANPDTRENNIDVSDVKKIDPDAIVISPGPGRPENAGNCGEIVKEFAGRIPILGVCLGHQIIGHACVECP